MFRIIFLFLVFHSSTAFTQGDDEKQFKCGLRHFPGMPENYFLTKEMGESICCIPCLCANCVEVSSYQIDYGFDCQVCCAIVGGSGCYYGDSTSFCGTAALCGVIACACADTESAYTCRPSLLCSGPLFALGKKLFGIGCNLLGAGCYMGTDQQTCSCCCVECGS